MRKVRWYLPFVILFFSQCSGDAPIVVPSFSDLDTVKAPEPGYPADWYPPHALIDPLKPNDRHCYVKQAFQKDGKIFLRINPIEIFTGDTAHQIRLNVIQVVLDKKEDLFKGPKKRGYTFIAPEANVLIVLHDPDTTSKIFQLSPSAKTLYWDADSTENFQLRSDPLKIPDYLFVYAMEDNYSHPFFVTLDPADSTQLIVIKEEFAGFY